ncbi:hypothetical protein KJ973_03010 [Patescibacteria group bacterium]|nr:hypothetical protein [Patescibacteria group bacterium]MBU1247046.1 hypothetical protein [Patescibacteria group bacterium]MBU1519635.1 hypothetical protein [Patescibacteria group bacterium]MBU1956561.1 hypothetical protein [Patescibacteria group bacterium]MBU2010550.1 hypothetical protein [Patescibacteria group bacterium]
MNIKYYIKKYTWFIILTAIILSFSFPSLGLIFTPYLTYLLMLLMFFSCLDIDLKKILEHLKNCKNKITILVIIHLSSPFLILLLKPFFSDEIFLGLILVTTISSGMSVVFLSNLYGGIASQALVIAFLSNIFSPISVPLLVLLFTKTNIEIDFMVMSLTMLRLVVIPIVIAMLLKNTRANKRLKNYGTYISIVVLFLLILGIISPVKSIVLSNLKISLMLGGLISVLVIINFFLGYFVGSNKAEKITYGISASYKNVTLSTIIALSLFGPLVALPSIIYTVVNNLFLIPLQLIFLKEKK